MSAQLTLPGAWLTCPACGERVTLLGQWSPWRREAVCRLCSIAHPYPTNWCTSDGHWRDDAPSDVRESSINGHNWLQEAAGGCREIAEGHTEWGGVLSCHRHPRPDCKRCRRQARSTGTRRYLGWKSGVSFIQLAMPVCQRCGQPHNRTFFSGQTKPTCEQCEAKASVESYYRMRGIFGEGDVEDVLDRLYAIRPDLFEVGVLPDYWFQLAMSEVMT